MSYAIDAVPVEQIVKTHITDGPNLDAFSRLRTSNIDTVFDSSFQYDLQPLIYQAVTANSATITHDANKVSAALTTAASPSSSAILQSKQYHRYIPGKSQLIAQTQVVGAAVANVVKRVGYFDSSNGIFLEQNGTTDVAFVRRTKVSGSVVDNRVVQADWNLDPLNGSGPSGLTLDLSKASILITDLQWLGMGRVRIGFNINGQIVYCHQFLNANVLDVPYMQTANLPVRWEAAGNGISTLYATCASVNSEGGADKFFGYQFAYARPVVTAGSGTRTYAFAIRPRATFNSIANRLWIRPLSFDCLVTGNSPVLVEVYYNATMGGTPSWADAAGTSASVEVDTAGTPSLTNAVKVAQFYVASSNQAKGEASKNFSARYPLTLDYAGTGYNHLMVFVTAFGGTSTCYPGFSWEEVR